MSLQGVTSPEIGGGNKRFEESEIGFRNRKAWSIREGKGSP